MDYYKHHICELEDFIFQSEKEGEVKLDVSIVYRMLDDGPEIIWDKTILCHSDTEGEKSFEPSNKDYDELEEIFQNEAAIDFNKW